MLCWLESTGQAPILDFDKVGSFVEMLRVKLSI